MAVPPASELLPSCEPASVVLNPLFELLEQLAQTARTTPHAGSQIIEVRMRFISLSNRCSNRTALPSRVQATARFPLKARSAQCASAASRRDEGRKTEPPPQVWPGVTQ